MIRHWHDAEFGIFSIVFLSIERSYQILTISLCLVYALRIGSLIRIGQLAVDAQVVVDGIDAGLNIARLKRLANSLEHSVKLILGCISHLWSCCLGCRLLLGLLCRDNNFAVFFSGLIADLVNEFALCVLFRIGERVVAVEEVREREDKCDGQDHRNDLSSHGLLRIECPIEYTHFFLQKPFQQPQ